MHYFIYYLIWLNSNGGDRDLNDYHQRALLTIIIPVSCYESTFNVSASAKESGIMAHSLAGLSRSDLIASSFAFSSPEDLRDRGVDVDQHAFLIEPTIIGLELFVWAHGKGEDGLRPFLSSELAGEPDLDIKLAHLARLKL